MCWTVPVNTDRCPGRNSSSPVEKYILWTEALFIARHRTSNQGQWRHREHDLYIQIASWWEWWKEGTAVLERNGHGTTVNVVSVVRQDTAAELGCSLEVCQRDYSREEK